MSGVNNALGAVDNPSVGTAVARCGAEVVADGVPVADAFTRFPRTRDVGLDLAPEWEFAGRRAGMSIVRVAPLRGLRARVCGDDAVRTMRGGPVVTAEVAEAGADPVELAAAADVESAEATACPVTTAAPRPATTAPARSHRTDRCDAHRR